MPVGRGPASADELNGLAKPWSYVIMWTTKALRRRPFGLEQFFAAPAPGVISGAAQLAVAENTSSKSQFLVPEYGTASGQGICNDLRQTRLAKSPRRFACRGLFVPEIRSLSSGQDVCARVAPSHHNCRDVERLRCLARNG